ncbi:NADP-dependent aldehyde dehydrogenase [Pseudoduganella flava]|uniref:NADP-dependent aldehyde dehydrogenase n=1 Tax=Pseudoduganella flava TaxID=871742 RepID=A0A562PZB7_9BURK|nr:hypothetical protein [Pseudoduganella flava]QGZ38681.1 hypothetical protein GO485_06175 [Pseudoduganella flava]TWI49744.1 NADP-dependent aldehyde dehydrogenase [Pseudoduganella flava]
MMHPPDRAAAAALPFAQAGAEQRACLLDAIGAALDGVRHRLPQQAAFDAGIAPAIALHEHDTLRRWLHTLAATLRDDADGAGTVPLGPVAAVGAHGSAYGLAGVHAMAALAAGCPVLAHAVRAPSCAELANLIAVAAAASRLPDSVFALADDDAALLEHHAIRAAICRGGVYAVPRLLPAVRELDGTEAAFVLPGALNGRAEYLGRELLAQPGSRPVVVAIDGDGYIDLREAIGDALGASPHGPFNEVDAAALLASPPPPQRAGGLLVRCADAAELVALAWALGPLYCASVHAAADDAALSARLLPVLRLAARHIHLNRCGGALHPTREAAGDAIGRFRRPVHLHRAPLDQPYGNRT